MDNTYCLLSSQSKHPEGMNFLYLQTLEESLAH